jgi:predicted dehydrogenase
VKIRRLVIQGLEAMFEVNYIRQELYKYEISYVRDFSDWSDILLAMTEGEMRRIPIKAEEPLKIELQQFIQSVAEKKPVPVTGEDGVKALELALLAEESGRDHRIMELG